MSAPLTADQARRVLLLLTFTRWFPIGLVIGATVPWLLAGLLEQYLPFSARMGVDPWPLQADGFGGSLTRIDPAAYGNDPANWHPIAPSPGLVDP